MIRIALGGTLVLMFLGCSSVSDTRGELVTSSLKGWIPEDPIGMVKVPTGSFIMGNSSGVSIADEDAPLKTVSLMGFYMDDTEITNAEYREYIRQVRDKSFRVALAERAQELLEDMTDEERKTVFTQVKSGKDKSIFSYAYLESDTSGLSRYKKFVLERNDYEIPKKINWDVALYYGDGNYKLPGEEYIEIMDQFMKYDSLSGEISFNDEQLVYIYEGSRVGEMSTLPEKIKIYPDEKVWMKDFAYAYNEPMQANYFKHIAYNRYPVVGVTWNQARAFCAFRTEQKNRYNKEQGHPLIPRFRLPTEAEWEYAARGGLKGASYPWGGPLLKDPTGCYMANFKPKRGNYMVDGAMYTADVKMYKKNGYGLYSMAGNVAEWTSTIYNEASYTLSSTMNPKIFKSSNDNGERVVRGGSWKDVAYFLRVSVRDHEHKDHARSYIGFRTVQDFMSGTKY